jgi:hypothetical protein
LVPKFIFPEHNFSEPFFIHDSILFKFAHHTVLLSEILNRSAQNINYLIAIYIKGLLARAASEALSPYFIIALLRELLDHGENYNSRRVIQIVIT